MAKNSARRARHGSCGAPVRASLRPFGVQWFHRAEATAVLVGQVARVLRIADDHRGQQDDDFAAAGTRALLAEQAADDRDPAQAGEAAGAARSEEHTSELQSLMRNSYAVFCLKKKK